MQEHISQWPVERNGRFFGGWGGEFNITDAMDGVRSKDDS